MVNLTQSPKELKYKTQKVCILEIHDSSIFFLAFEDFTTDDAIFSNGCNYFPTKAGLFTIGIDELSGAKSRDGKLLLMRQPPASSLPFLSINN